MSINDKKKILYVITKSNFGGAQRYVYDLATGITSYGLPVTSYESVVALGGTGEQGAQTGRLNELLQKAGVRTIVLKNASRNIHILGDVFLFFELLRIFRKEHPDVIHLNSSKVGGLGTLAGRLQVIDYRLQRLIRKLFPRYHLSPITYHLSPIVFTAHGFAFAEDRPLLARLVIRLLSWVTVALTTHTVLITTAEYERVRSWPFVGHKAILISNGIAPVSFMDKTTAREFLAEKTKNYQLKTKNCFLIGSIAELHPNKGLVYLIEAFSLLKTTRPTKRPQSFGRENYQLKTIIIGEGEEHKNLDLLIKKQGLQDTVFLAGFVENAASYLKAFDIFVLPSLKEGLPYVLLEAGMAGLPTVATEIGGAPDIVRHETTGLLVPPANAKQLAAAISSLCADEQARLRLGKNAGEAVNASFTVENMVAKTARLYKM